MIAKITDSLDQIPEKILLGIDFLMAAFVLLAHGGYTALTISKGGDIPLMNFVSIPLSTFLVITSIIGFTSQSSRKKILSIHALIFIIGASYTLYWGLSLLVKGFPKGNIAWGVGLYTFFCVYPVYLFRRTLLNAHISKSRIVKYAHVFTLIIALLIDISVFTKVSTHYENHRREVIEKYRVK